MRYVTPLILILLAMLVVGCATSPTGRRQLDLVSDQQAAQAGDQSFQEIKKQTPVDNDPGDNEYAKCIVHALSVATGAPRGGGNWTVTVFKDPKTVNAFALPGGHVSVYTGIFSVAKTPGELAAVLGHEMGHVQAGHGAERMSDQAATALGVDLAAILAGIDQSSATGQATMAALGAGAQVGVLLPFSRAQESEADKLGTQYMAQAGFDPHQALDLWHNMMSMNQGGAPPAILSDHPADASRLQALQAQMPEDVQRYQQAQAQGRHPGCKAPGGG
ncbi:MAG TPA: M48 family metallopeptidase [Gammaproteobacteria bacterium]|nr:M48 family metallopeptidase [Gammaproteobacteria bacterium]